MKIGFVLRGGQIFELNSILLFISERSINGGEKRQWHSLIGRHDAASTNGILQTPHFSSSDLVVPYKIGNLHETVFLISLDGNFSHTLTTNQHHVWPWQRRKGKGKGEEPIQPRGSPIPRWTCPPFLAQRQLR